MNRKRNFAENLVLEVLEFSKNISYTTSVNIKDINLTKYLNESYDYLYFLTVFDKNEHEERIFYIGKTKVLYNRIQTHKMTYEFDNVHIFQVNDDNALYYESCMIKHFSPFYNIVHNPNRESFKEIKITNYKTKKEILKNIDLEKRYYSKGYYFLQLKQVHYNALNLLAKNKNISLEQVLHEIFDEYLNDELKKLALQDCKSRDIIKHNLISVKQYAELHNSSVEQVKVYCQKGRINGAFKFQRDWLIPKNSPYPKDKRYKKNHFLSKW